MTFIPEKPSSVEQHVPFYEDVTGKEVPGRWTTKPITQLQKEISQLLQRLNAALIAFIPGTHAGSPKRYGYQITFKLNGIPGRVDIAALPMRLEHPKKKDRALAQALFLTRNWLEAEVHSSLYRPGAIALVPFLIGEGGKTVTEMLVERQELPLLMGG